VIFPEKWCTPVIGVVTGIIKPIKDHKARKKLYKESKPEKIICIQNVTPSYSVYL